MASYPNYCWQQYVPSPPSHHGQYYMTEFQLPPPGLPHQHFGNASHGFQPRVDAAISAPAPTLYTPNPARESENAPRPLSAASSPASEDFPPTESFISYRPNRAVGIENHVENPAQSTASSPSLQPTPQGKNVAKKTAPKSTTRQPGKAAMTKRGKSAFTGAELEQLARVANDMDIFSAPYGEVGAWWAKLGDALRAAGIAGSDNLFKEKLKALLLWHDDPDKAPEAISKALSGSFEITIAALLDSLAGAKEEYEAETEKGKEDLKKKKNDDMIGGIAIRDASLQWSRKRARSPSVGHDTVIEDVGMELSARNLSFSTIDLCDSDSDVEIISSFTTTAIHVKAEPTPPVILKVEPEVVAIPLTRHNKENQPLQTKKPKLKKELESTSKTKKSPTPSSSNVKIEASPSFPTTSSRSTPRIKGKESGFNLETFFTEERAERQKFQERIITTITQGNEEYKKAQQETQNFYNRFMAVLERSM